MKNLKKIISCILIISIASALVLSLTACNDGKHVKKDIAFGIDNSTEIMDIPVTLFLNKQDSGITLRKNGTVTLRLALNDAVPNLVNKSFNISTMLGEMDFNQYMNDYVAPLFPGFTLQDIPYSLGLIESSLGIKITGLDLDSPNTKALFEGLKTGKFAENIVVPKNIALEYNGPYEIKELLDADNEPYKAVYLGKYNKNGQPFIVMGLDKNEEGKNTIICRVNFINFYMLAIEK